MKNIHVLPTDKPSRLHLGNSGLILCDLKFNSSTINGQHIYITSDEEIKESDWYIFFNNPVNIEIKKDKNDAHGMCSCKKIILTTNQDLINNGVQAIDDEFLDWFVKNPSCEEVEVDKGYRGVNLFNYKIIIPKKEPKQEMNMSKIPTAEEFFNNFCNKHTRVGQLNDTERLEVMIEFAKLHVEAALKEIEIQRCLYHYPRIEFINKEDLISKIK